MSSSAEIHRMIGWKQRFILESPVLVARFGTSLVDNLQFLRLVNWQKLEGSAPTSLFFNTCEFCNARCTFCGQKTSNPQHIMKNEVFFKAAKEYYAAGGRRIDLNSLTGEPLLDPGFFEKTSFLRSLGSFDYLEFNTNGILLNKDEVVDSVLDSGITRLKISTAAFEKKTYERMMGVKKYDEFMSGVGKLLARAQERGYPILIHFDIRGSMGDVDTEDFSTKILPFLESGQGKVTLSFLRFYYDWNGQVKADELPENCVFRSRVRIRTRPCEGSFWPCVMSNGEVRICPANYGGSRGRSDDLVIGDLENDSIMDIWNSPTTKKVRRTTYGSSSNEVCRNCRWYRPV